MDVSRILLLPIDLQRAFHQAPWPRRWNTKMSEKGQALLGFWREKKAPLLHVRHDSVEPQSTLRPGLPGNDFLPGFGPVAGEAMITKSVNSSFIGTDLDIRLRRLGIDTIAAFGISTDMCVSTTVRHGANLGYRMILIEDACDCFDLKGRDGAIIPAETIHAAHVASLTYDFCTVTSVDEITR
jgi:nicotinamidase-related amidase